MNFATNTWVAQVVVVKKTSTKAFPKEKYLGNNWHPEESLVIERTKAQKTTKSCLGFGLFMTRGMSAYTYRIYAKTPNGVVEIGACHKEEDVETHVKAFFANLGPLKDRVEKVEKELRSHDWWCHMSDAPGVCSAGERHMDRIKPLLASLPPKTAKSLWKKCAPEEFPFPFDQIA